MSSQAVSLDRGTIKLIRKKILVVNPITRRLVRGRGFSVKEIRELGLTMNLARILGIPVDPRRKTLYTHNVEFLKEILEKANVEIKAIKTYEAVTPTVSTKPETPTIAGDIDAVCERFMAAIEAAKRRKKETLLKTLSDSLISFANSTGLNISEEEVEKIFNIIMNDLSIAGYGKLSEKFFSKSSEWDSSMAREMVLTRLREFIKEKEGEKQ